jgi:hypothetical protein
MTRIMRPIGCSAWIVDLKFTRQAEFTFRGRRWGSYLRSKDRANSFANRESSSVLIIRHVWKHMDVLESVLIGQLWRLRASDLHE